MNQLDFRESPYETIKIKRITRIKTKKIKIIQIIEDVNILNYNNQEESKEESKEKSKEESINETKDEKEDEKIYEKNKNEDDDTEFWTLFDKFKIDMGIINISDEEKEKRKAKEINEQKIIDSLYNKNQVPKLCDYCPSQNIQLEKGYFVCQDCSAIVSKYIDNSAEWRNFSSDDSRNVDMNRCGMPSNDLLPSSSLGTMIGFGNEKESYTTRLLRRYQLWGSMPYKERQLYGIFDTLSIKAVSHGITKNIIDEAKNLYKKFVDEKQGRSDNKNALIASSLYMACKLNNVPRSEKEIAAIFNIKPSVMTKGCKKFQEIMGINTTSSSASDFISRFCCPLNLSQEFQDICKIVVEKIEELDIACDNTPTSLASSVIFFCIQVLQYDIHKKDVSRICNTSDITITKCYNKLSLYKKEIIDDNISQYVESHKSRHGV